MFEHIQLEVGSYGVNCHILVCPVTKEAVIIDPGDEAWRIKEKIPAGIKLGKILLTHAHLDHIAAVNEIQQLTGAKVYLHPEDQWLAEHANEQARWLGMDNTSYNPVKTDVSIKVGEPISFGEYTFEILFVPGHSPGSVAFYYDGKEKKETPMIFSGDVLFSGSVGRTDLWRGDTALLLNGIKKKLFPLPDSTVVWPGHGPETTIGHEKKYNPYLA